MAPGGVWGHPGKSPAPAGHSGGPASAWEHGCDAGGVCVPTHARREVPPSRIIVLLWLEEPLRVIESKSRWDTPETKPDLT